MLFADFYSCDCKKKNTTHVGPFLLGSCWGNNRAQCPSRVRPTACSRRAQMSPERDTSLRRPKGRDDPFLNMFHFKLEAALLKKRSSADGSEPMPSVRGGLGFTLPVKPRVCHYHQGGDLTTHTLQTQGANFGNVCNPRVALKKKKDSGIFISICTHTQLVACIFSSDIILVLRQGKAPIHRGLTTKMRFTNTSVRESVWTLILSRLPSKYLNTNPGDRSKEQFVSLSGHLLAAIHHILATRKEKN